MTDHDSPEASFDPLGDLLDVLDLTYLGEAKVHFEGVPGDDESAIGESSSSVFVGRSQPQPHKRVFGGQVLAQSVIAAGRSVAETVGPERPIHSLHAYFIRPGDSEHPIRFTVENMRDGRSFSTRRVHAIQRGEVILSMLASFQDPAGGLDHQDEMPTDIAPPESLPSAKDLFGDIDHPTAQFFAHRRPIDMRHSEGPVYVIPGEEEVAAQNVWIKTVGPLPDDPLIHAAVLAYASDYTLLESVLRRHGLVWSDRRLRPASLDHAMWFHRPVRADDWLLYTQRSPSAQSGRGLGIGRMFGPDGRLGVSVAQEGMIRVRES